ncbi:MAG: Fur family transcriptional regulator [Chloroflexota bacterium]
MPDKHYHTLIEDLKERGMRVTPQRAIILEAIESLHGHVTAEEIFAVVKEVNAYVSLATVYRTLEMLRDLDLVTESHMGTATTHYALRTHATHHHAICRNCHTSIDLPKDIFQSLSQQLSQEFEFKADTNHLVIFGWCTNCQ